MEQSLATQCGAATAQSESRLPTPQGGPNGLESSSNQKPSTGDSEATTSPHVAMDDGLKRTLTAHYVLAQQLTDVQQERDHLKQTIQAVKRCVRCKQKYQFLENSEVPEQSMSLSDMFPSAKLSLSPRSDPLFFLCELWRYARVSVRMV
eukprot:GHVN01050905.1.p1 GENE.GHVN01050905.1~~GHVN01050905.1.p1  ORF type:complete len:149 (+),score=6.31 GHVN01050905.1:189-635(+)